MLLAALPPGAQAAGADGPPAISWEQYGGILIYGAIMSIALLVNLILSIWDKTKPKPSYAEQFAPKTHTHAQYLTIEAHDSQVAECMQERRHAVKHNTLDREAIQRQMDHLSEIIRTEFAQQEKRNEERASLIHTRVNAISAPLNQMIGKFETHMEAHRKGTP